MHGNVQVRFGEGRLEKDCLRQYLAGRLLHCQRAVQYRISLVEAAQYVRPTPPEDIERLREWASGRCLSASTPGIYQRNGEATISAGRRLKRGGPSNN
jgi:hypothetical protein